MISIGPKVDHFEWSDGLLLCSNALYSRVISLTWWHGSTGIQKFVCAVLLSCPEELWGGAEITQRILLADALEDNRIWQSLPVLNQSWSVTYRDMVQVPCVEFWVFDLRILDGRGMDKTFLAIGMRFAYNKSHKKSDSVHGRCNERCWIKIVTDVEFGTKVWTKTTDYSQKWETKLEEQLF